MLAHPAPCACLSTAGQYLAAADGARGGLRQQLGVGMGGPGAIQHLINIHFVSPQVGFMNGCVCLWAFVTAVCHLVPATDRPYRQP